MSAKLHTGGAAMALIGAKSDTGVPFLIQGTASNPEFRPDMKALAAGRVKRLEVFEDATGAPRMRAAVLCS